MINDKSSLEKPQSNLWIDFNVLNFLTMIKKSSKLRNNLILNYSLQMFFMVLMYIFSLPFILAIIPSLFTLFFTVPLNIALFSLNNSKQKSDSMKNGELPSIGTIFPIYYIAVLVLVGSSAAILMGLYGILLLFATSSSAAGISIAMIILPAIGGIAAIILIYMVHNFCYNKIKEPDLSFRKNLRYSWIDAKKEWSKLYGLIFSRALILIPLLIISYTLQFGITWILVTITNSELVMGGIINPTDNFLVLFVLIFIINAFILLMNLVFVQQVYEKNK